MMTTNRAGVTLGAVLGLAGAAAFAAGALLPHGMVRNILGEETPRTLVNLTPATPLGHLRSLAPAVAFLLMVGASVALLARGRRAAAGILVGTGAYLLVTFVRGILPLWAAGLPLLSGAFLWLGGAGGSLAGGLAALGASEGSPRRASVVAAVTILAGAALVTAGHLLPFAAQSFGEDELVYQDVSLERAIIPASVRSALGNPHTWGVLLLVVLVAVALGASRRARRGQLGGLGGGGLAAVGLLELAGFAANTALVLSVATLDARPGLFLGLAGAALLLGGAGAARRAAPTENEETLSPAGGA